MNPEAYQRQAHLPIGAHRLTGEPLTLAEWLEDPESAADPAELSLEQQIALVRARWLTGDWQDIVYGTDGLVDRDRAIRELQAQSGMGRHLLEIGLDAIAMVREDAGESRNG